MECERILQCNEALSSGHLKIKGYLEMVHVSLCPHNQFTGWDGLTTRAARPTVPK